MDALRSAETEHREQPETNHNKISDTGLALEAVEVTTDTAPASEFGSTEHNDESTPTGETGHADSYRVVEAALKSGHPAKRVTTALLAGVVIVVVTTGGYYYWNRDSSAAAAGTLIASPPPVRRLPDFTEVAPVSAVTAADTPSPAKHSSARTRPALPPSAMNNDTSPPAAAGQAVAPKAARIQIHRSRPDSSIDPLLVEAYTAYQHRDYLQAGQLYSRVLRKQPGNRDALLGIAGISILTGDIDTARRYYERLLDISPGDITARAALQSMQAGIDPLRQSSQLQHMLESDQNNPHLHFSLGNRYLELGEWKKAQQAFFDAVRLDPDHPDYNYNLAVSLDHLGASDQALNYYLKAQELASYSATLFNSELLAKRIRELQQPEARQS